MIRVLGLFICLIPIAVNAEPFKEASPESLLQATKQMNALDKAILDGIDVLKSGKLKSVSAHSKYFSSLVKTGENLFGASVLEPLGNCFAAGVYAQSWWSAQLSAAFNKGVETIPGSIKDALNQYHADRVECLKWADPVASTKANAESDAELKKMFGGGKECLKSYRFDPVSKETIEIPMADHCKN